MQEKLNYFLAQPCVDWINLELSITGNIKDLILRFVFTTCYSKHPFP